MDYPVNEIFYSLQGEGYHCGHPAIFIRLSGCNLNCPWCDTDHSTHKKMNEFAIVAEANNLIRGNNNPYDILFVITGGEPTLYDLEPLVSEISRFGNKSALETNGVNIGDTNQKLFEWITVSPKIMVEDCNPFFEDENFVGDELKVVLEEGIDKNMLAELPSKLTHRFQHYYIQPCSENYKPAVQFVKEHPEWKLSVQMHKLINVR